MLSRLCRYSFPTCGIMTLLFQEAFTGAYYPNSTIIAAAFGLTALYVSAVSNGRSGKILAGILLGAGIWMRFDAVFFIPPLLILPLRHNWRAAVRSALTTGPATGLTAAAAIYASGSNLSRIVLTVQAHMKTPAGALELRCYVAFFSLLCVFLILIGLLHLSRNRRWFELGLVASGVAPCLAFLSGSITTPKYMYYSIPFFALLALFGIDAIVRLRGWRRRALFGLAVVLFLLQYVLGVRLSGPAFRSLGLGGPGAGVGIELPIVRWASRQAQAALVLGPGSWVHTHDGIRLTSGVLFSPLLWARRKELKKAEWAKADAYLKGLDQEDVRIHARSWDEAMILLRILLSAGYECARSVRSRDAPRMEFRCVKEGRRVTVAMEVHKAPQAAGTL